MVRPMVRADLPSVLVLWRALMDNGVSMDPRWTLTADADAWMAAWARDVMLTRTPFPHAHVYDDDAGITGFVSGFPDAGSPILDEPKGLRIGDLYVAERARRRGIGRTLVNAQIRAADAVGYKHVIVETLVHDDRAVAFWQAMGFDAMRVQLRRPAQT